MSLSIPAVGYAGASNQVSSTKDAPLKQNPAVQNLLPGGGILQKAAYLLIGLARHFAEASAPQSILVRPPISGAESRSLAPLDFSRNEIDNSLAPQSILILRADQLQQLPVGTKLISLTLGQVNWAVTVVQDKAGKKILSVDLPLSGDNLGYGILLPVKLHSRQQLDAWTKQAIAASGGAAAPSGDAAAVFSAYDILGAGVAQEKFSLVHPDELAPIAVGTRLKALLQSTKYVIVQSAGDRKILSPEGVYFAAEK